MRYNLYYRTMTYIHCVRNQSTIHAHSLTREYSYTSYLTFPSLIV